MDIKEYISSNKITQVQFSKKLGVGHIYLNAIINKRRTPSPSLALKIEEATGGQVTLRELLFPEEK